MCFVADCEKNESDSKEFMDFVELVQCCGTHPNKNINKVPHHKDARDNLAGQELLMHGKEAVHRD